MFLVEIDNLPTIVEDKFVKFALVDSQWVPVSQTTEFEPGMRVQVLKMPDLEMVECSLYCQGFFSISQKI